MQAKLGTRTPEPEPTGSAGEQPPGGGDIGGGASDELLDRIEAERRPEQRHELDRQPLPVEVAVDVVQDPELIRIMTDFIAANPELWNEDIGEE